MKLTKLFVPALLLAGMTMGVISCGDKPKDEPEKPMTSVEQKDKVETAALSVVNAINPADFQYLIDEMKYVRDHYTLFYGEYFDISALTDWLTGCLQTIDQTQVTRIGQDRPVSEQRGDYTYVTYNENFRKLYTFANFTGHFTANDSAWVKSENDSYRDLQLSYKDQNGADCTLTLSTEGEGVPVHFNTDQEYISYNLDTASKTHTDYYETTYGVVEVPQTLILSLKTGRDEHFCLTLNPDLTQMQAEDFDLSKDSYSFNCSVKVEKYVFSIERIAYAPSKAAEVSLKATIAGQPVGTFTLTSGTLAATNTGLQTAKSVELFIDLAGQVQVKGSCVDALRFADLISEAEENNTKESTYKSKISQANDLLNLVVFYDGGQLEQARVKLEVFEDKEKGVWECEPVIYFVDGSSYSTFEAFFNETDFSDLIAAVQKLIEDFGILYYGE